MKNRRKGADSGPMEDIPEASEMTSNSLVDELIGRNRG